MKRLVLDTNILISAVFWKGNARKIYDLAKAKEYILLTSKEIETEFIRVLGYPKFGLNPAEILPLLNEWKQYSRSIPIKSRICKIKADPADNIFLNCAVDGEADYIISGDRHLLSVGVFDKIKIVTAKQFIELEGE